MQQVDLADNMRYPFFALVCLFQIGVSVVTRSHESWIQHPDVDFSQLVFWKEFPAVSRIACIVGCYDVFSRGCGYQRKENRCQVYMDWSDTTDWQQVDGMDWSDTTDWKQVDGMDYYVTTSEWVDLRRYQVPSALLIAPSKLTWLDARSYCEEKGGHLYIMDKDQKRQALKDHFERKGVSLSNTYWLGLNDRKTEGQWLWEDGRTVTQDVHGHDWLEGVQDCGVLSWKTDSSIADRKCANTYHFLCEMSLDLR